MDVRKRVQVLAILLGDRTFKFLGSTASAVRILRAPTVVAAVAALALTVPDQSREVYRWLWEEPGERWLTLTATFLTVIAYSLVAFSTSRAFILAAAEQPHRRTSSHWRPIAETLAYVLAAWPYLALALGFVLAIGANTDDAVVNLNLAFAAGALVTSAVVIVALLRLALRRYAKDSAESIVGSFARSFVRRNSAAFAVLGLVAVIVAGVLFGANIAVFLGAPAVFFLFCATLLLITSLFAWIRDRFGISLTLTLVVCAALWSTLGLNRNHYFRTLASPSDADAPTLPEAFRGWLASRADLHDYASAGRPYPVFLVSAEGGGAYAAYHTASVLARIQDSCQRFAQHLFAISGVSGGSLGASVFAASASALAENKPELDCAPHVVTEGGYQRVADRFFEHDLLTPVVAAALFPDFLQAFLPFRVPPFDRARALEQSFEGAWAASAPKGVEHLFRSSFRGLWRMDAAAPALILNTTEVSMGRREFIAPFKFNLNVVPQSGQHIGALTDLPVSTAAGLSARFPWLTPAGMIHFDGADYQFADGGYFDNSGAATAQDVIGALRPKGWTIASAFFRAALDQTPAAGRAQRLLINVGDRQVAVRFILIVVRAQGVRPTRGTEADILVPVQTLLSTRRERGMLSVRQSLANVCPECDPDFVLLEDSLRLHILPVLEITRSGDAVDRPYPLGWLLSDRNRNRIRAIVGDNRRCRSVPLRRNDSITVNAHVEINDCLYQSVYRDLQ